MLVVCAICKGYTAGGRLAKLGSLRTGPPKYSKTGLDNKYNPHSWNQICKGIHPKESGVTLLQDSYSVL